MKRSKIVIDMILIAFITVIGALYFIVSAYSIYVNWGKRILENLFK
jgi:hypothetical protein